MNITYNGLIQPQRLITFTDIPNILKVEDSTGGTYARVTLTFDGNLKAATSNDGQWYITFLGETISSVIDYNNAVNKNFYAAPFADSTAASVANALSNCSTISANFTIEHDDDEVVLVARSIGAMWSGVRNYFSSNISTTYMTYSATDGTANSQLLGSIVSVNVSSNNKHITTLKKSYYGDECAFDMSPLLTSIAKVGDTIPYRFDISYVKNGSYTDLGSLTGNYIAQGYMVNQGYKYLQLAPNTITIAQNYSRGSSRGVSNSTILYVYGTTIPVSFYRTEPYSTEVAVSYKNSAFEQITATTVAVSGGDGYNKLNDRLIQLSQTYLDQSFYVDISIGSDTIRYNVIKPIKATEYYQRIYWRNSYGGISFFDFTGHKSESRDVEVSTYQKNIFDYYVDSKNELDKIYDNDVKYTVTLKSHLFENDGKYIFNDMMQSPELWVERNGETYGIILDSVSVEEQDRNNIYEATVKYHYSQKPSLI